MKCSNCGIEVPDTSRFCLGCGKDITGKAPPQGEEDSSFNIYSMLLLSISFMMFFFSLIPLFIGEWVGAVLMDSVGVLMVVVALINIWSSRKHAEKLAQQRQEAEERMQKAREAALAKIKCRYCGGLNDHSALKCETCGATL